MSDLRIASPILPFSSQSITSDQTMHALTTPWDIVAGPRYVRPRLSSDQATWNIDFDLGTTFADLSGSVEYLLVARADLMTTVNWSNEVVLSYSDDDSTYTPLVTATGATLLGPHAQDEIVTCAASAEHRYWRLAWSSDTDNIYEHSKVCFGNFFTFDYDPNYSYEIIQPNAATWYSSSGTGYANRTATAYYEYTIAWKHQSDAKAKSFEDTIVRYSNECPVFLYEAGLPYSILDGKRLVHAQLTDYSITKDWTEYNTIACKFRELVG